MPLIKTMVAGKCDQDKKERLALTLSKICAEGLSNTESYVASLIEDDAVFAIGGAKSDAALVEVRSIGGLNGTVNSTLSKSICDALDAELGIAGDKVYINFIDVSASDWGWNGSTFG
jgi:phenylpyruvate tautomerase PptA (4-oxalocrotonate tautomerase family)